MPKKRKRMPNPTIERLKDSFGGLRATVSMYGEDPDVVLIEAIIHRPSGYVVERCEWFAEDGLSSEKVMDEVDQYVVRHKVEKTRQIGHCLPMVYCRKCGERLSYILTDEGVMQSFCGDVRHI